ncbi:integrase [Xanthomonas campestris pv. campestris]|uniref:integrase n=1 Tax=Xanthomonas campestris TaxID=339 RepID=UPI001E56FF1A|nr:integrase [Xanthomonas campestris]MCD0252493.1 integrase [Xanthomonas campestris pv. campestris]MEB1300215.1 integrase [Xanthomonas campestris pv. campestris]MEB1309009.1 integrase [Xanthomonas campestris pv. campestris]MEB1334060.1 integrase [Xanthomonas campestris pv. campestris]MEB1903056.1 integrase [Xanthomonas campestris pv. campestris]
MVTDAIIFVPSIEADARTNIRRFIDLARNQLAIFGQDLPFESNTWDVTDAVLTKAKGRKRERINFSTLEAMGGAIPAVMPEPFRSFAKAYIRYLSGVRPVKAIHARVAALRALAAALAEGARECDPVRADSAVFNRATQLLVEHFSAGAAYRIGQQLEILANFMKENALSISRTTWRSPIRRPSDTVRVGADADRRRAEKLPSAAALEALPRIFLMAQEPADVVTAAAAAIMLAAPERISEVLTLPSACEVVEARPGKDDAYGLRWWPAKGAKPGVKWMVPAMVPVVQEALRRIRKVTMEARDIAGWYERNPGQIYLALDVEHLRNSEWLDLEEVARIIGLTGRMGANAWCKARGIRMVRFKGQGNALYVRFKEVEKVIVSLLPRGFPTLDKASGVSYANALFTVRRNELGMQRGAYRCMIELVSVGQINTGLGSRSAHGLSSIFSRFGFTEPDGSPIILKSHAFRHYLNTLAQAGGLSQLDVAKWSGRLDVRQNEAYDHVSPRQMLQSIRSAVGTDEMIGPLSAPLKRALIKRDDFAQLMVPTAHLTELGYCIHDYTSSPCQLHADCINCQELICIKGDVQKVLRLREQLTEAVRLKQKAEVAVGQGYAGSDRWMEHHRVTVDRLTQLLSIMEDPDIPDGTPIQMAATQAPFRLQADRVVNALAAPVAQKSKRRRSENRP